MFERHDKKLVIFAFQGRFRELLPIVLGSVEIYKEFDSLYILEKNDKKIVIFAFMAVFVSYCLQFWGARVIYMAHDTLYC
jgi:hypothetical protein